MKKDEDRVVLRRGMVEHAWHRVRETPRPIGSTDAPSPRLRLPRAGLSPWVLLFVAGLMAASVIGLIFALALG